MACIGGTRTRPPRGCCLHPKVRLLAREQRTRTRWSRAKRALRRLGPSQQCALVAVVATPTASGHVAGHAPSILPRVSDPGTAPEPRAWHPHGGAPVAPRIFRGLGPGAAAFSRRNPRWRRTPIGVAITGASATLATSEICNTARSSPRADSERYRYSGPGVLSSRPAHTTAAPSQRRMRQRLAGPREPHPSANTAAQAEGL